MRKYMQIGRNIYYDKATGNVLVDTGERAGDVIETTIDQDFASYTALQERVPESVGCLQLEYGQFFDNFLNYRYHIDPTTETIVWDIDPIDGGLEEVKQLKIDQLNDMCNQTISAGFTSDALGSANTYDFKNDDQINLGGMLNAITAGLVTGSIVWKASGVPQSHTVDQFKQVFADGLQHKNNNIGKYWTLKAQLLAVTNVEDVKAIVW